MALVWAVPGAARAEAIRVAVASNFAAALKSLSGEYERRTGNRLVISSGGTGKHFAQISNGAPFDVFLAADRRSPELLEASGLAVEGSRFTYAVGRLVLWSPEPGRVDPEGRVLDEGNFRRLAVANPDLAPYGAAAREVLESRRLWQPLRHRIVLGENIGQTYQFVASGAAELGFVALSQVRSRGTDAPGSGWTVPAGLHAPIEQQAVLLRDSAAARGFLAFLRADGVRAAIREFGYSVP